MGYDDSLYTGVPVRRKEGHVFREVALEKEEDAVATTSILSLGSNANLSPTRRSEELVRKPSKKLIGPRSEMHKVDINASKESIQSRRGSKTDLAKIDTASIGGPSLQRSKSKPPSAAHSVDLPKIERHSTVCSMCQEMLHSDDSEGSEEAKFYRCEGGLLIITKTHQRLHY